MSRGPLWLEQAAPQRRFGVKGAGAADLLRQLGLSVPSRPNCWAPLRAQDREDSPNVIARLGNTEFFIEEQGEAPGIGALEAAMPAPAAYPVLRQDSALLLGGVRAPEVLAEVCNVQFAVLPLTPRPVVMTLMTGVAVLVLPQRMPGPSDDAIVFRIWCDPSFGAYLRETLAEVIRTTSGRAA